MKKERPLKTKFKKSRLIKGGLLLLVVALLTGSSVFMFAQRTPSPVKKSEIDLYPVIRDEDVFKDAIYVKLRTRDYGYITYEGETLFKEDQTGDYSKQDVYCRFFRDYFDAIVEGDVIVFKSFYATPPVKEDFTHQKVLNIDINQTTSTQTELNGVGYTAENFIITYNIFQNNGTFRNDLSQSRFDATGTFKAIAIEEIYSIVELNGQWKIVSVTRSKIF